MKKIILLEPRSDLSGSVIQCFEYLKRLKQEFQFKIILFEKGPIYNKYENEGFNVLILPYSFPKKNKLIRSTLKYIINFIKVLFLLKKIIIEEKIDIIHANTIINLYGGVLGKLTNRRIIYSIHEYFGLYNKYLFEIFRLNLKIFKPVVIYVSNAQRSIYSKGSTVILNGVDIKYIIRKSKKPIIFVPTLKNKKAIINIGGLNKNKNQEFIIKNINKLLNSIEDSENYIFLFIGDYNTDYYEKLKKLIYEVKIEEKIKFLGKLDNPYPYLSKSSLLIVSSKIEVQPITILEAFALKVPVVAVRLEGIKDQIIDGETGFLYNLKDRDEFIEKASKLLNQKELKNKIVKNAYSYVCKNFSVQRNAKKYEKIYFNM